MGQAHSTAGDASSRPEAARLAVPPARAPLQISPPVMSHDASEDGGVDWIRRRSRMLSRINHSLSTTPIIEEHSLVAEAPPPRPNRRSRFVRRAHSSLSSLPNMFGRRSTLQSSDTSSAVLDHQSFISNLRSPGRLPTMPPLEMSHPSVADVDDSEYVPIMPSRRRRSGRPAGLLTDRLASLR